MYFIDKTFKKLDEMYRCLILTDQLTTNETY